MCTGLVSSLSGRSGSSTSSSACTPAKIPSPCASSHGNCGADDGCAYGVTSSVRRHRIRPVPTPCSLPITPAPKFPATWHSAGQCLSACWISSPNSATEQTAYPLATAPACSERSPIIGLDGIGAVEKDEMRALVLRGGPWSDAERAAIFDYCESDVAALARLLPAMLPKIDLPRALLRGRYMSAAARMERNGVPIDVSTLELLKAKLVEDTGSTDR